MPQATGERWHAAHPPETYTSGEKWYACHKKQGPKGDRHWARRDPERARATLVVPAAARVYGERQGSAKLTDQLVIISRRSRRAGQSLVGLAQAAGVTTQTMLKALTGRSWSHVDSIEPPVPPTVFDRRVKIR
jgi:hypothetical protein